MARLINILINCWCFCCSFSTMAMVVSFNSVDNIHNIHDSFKGCETMIEQSICEALGTTEAYQCALELIKTQAIALAITFLIPFLVHLLLFFAFVRFGKGKGYLILVILGIPIAVMLFLFAALPYTMNLF